MALYDSVREITWLRALLGELGYLRVQPTTLYEDNKGCISITTNRCTDPKTKRIDVKYHYTREQVQNCIVRIVYNQTNDMIADALTKPVNKGKFNFFRSQLGVKDFGPPAIRLWAVLISILQPNSSQVQPVRLMLRFLAVQRFIIDHEQKPVILSHLWKPLATPTLQ